MRKYLTEIFAQSVTQKITQSIEGLLKNYQNQTDKKLDQVLGHVESLRIEVKNIEHRLQSKEIKDKTEYGHVQYKLSSLQSELIGQKKNKLDDPSN
tara:strand:- start:10391 stop:10678 length:288 start_codon:yes stop_codon:yes gene_type:complete